MAIENILVSSTLELIIKEDSSKLVQEKAKERLAKINQNEDNDIFILNDE